MENKKLKTDKNIGQQLANALLVSKDLALLSNNTVLSIFITTMFESYLEGKELALLRHCLNYIQEQNPERAKIIEKELNIELDKLRQKRKASVAEEAKNEKISDADFLRSLGIKKTSLKI